MEEATLEEIYSSGEITLEEAQKIRNKFTLTCNHCASKDVAIMTEMDDDGYCETCSSPYARATIKCIGCGQALSIR